METQESELPASQGELSSRDLEIEALQTTLIDAHLSAQILEVKRICDRAWCCDYKKGLDRLRDHFLENPQTDLRTLNLISLQTDGVTLRHANTIGRKQMPDAFSEPSESPNSLMLYFCSHPFIFLFM